jgi:hypothetical protein
MQPLAVIASINISRVIKRSKKQMYGSIGSIDIHAIYDTNQTSA